ncbi:MAG: ABC transporter permease [Lachnospiraceae bacterium]
MQSIREIFNKEMARVFKDRKMMFSVFILPVVLMIGIMSIMNNLMSKMENDIKDHIPVIYIQNTQESFDTFLNASKEKYKITRISTEEEKQKAKNGILKGKIDILIEFPLDFEQQIREYKDGNHVPQVKTYYNPSEDYSNAAHGDIAKGVLENYRLSLLAGRVGNLEQIAVFHVDSDNKEMMIQDSDKASGKMLGMMLPYFITLLLFAGAMGIGTDMIAGEKERGTMSSLLVSPIKRSSIVLGKVCSLMAISGISSLIYIAAMGIFMPLTMKSMTGGGAKLQLSLSVTQIVMFGVLLLLLAFLYSTIIVLVSVFAKTVKEASSYIMPVYMAVLVVGMMTMFSTGKMPIYTYLIPIYNSSMAFKGILSREITMGQYGMTIGITLVLGIILTGVIVKAFESEKVMSQ